MVVLDERLRDAQGGQSPRVERLREEAPLIPTSAHTGLGIGALKQAIADICRKVEQKSGSQWFRLAIDRSFIVQGHGTVVTGSATSGSVKIDDELPVPHHSGYVAVEEKQPVFHHQKITG